MLMIQKRGFFHSFWKMSTKPRHIVVVMVMKEGIAKFNPEVWITAYPIPYEKKELTLY